MERKRVDLKELFADTRDDYVKICAPMVRYSKLEFRQLVRRYNADLCYTPMILAESFWRSEKCRQNDFTITAEDSPLIVQFASNNTNDLVRSAEYVAPYVDGIDINCGCPQDWAMKKGMGSALLTNPELIEDFVKTLKRNTSGISISTKIRLLDTPDRTVELAKRLEACGVDFITIHGRTPSQKSSGPVYWEQVRLLKQSIGIPVVGNGGITTLQEADECQAISGCDGIMVASAILQNPTLFSGSPVTTRDCVEYWLKSAKHMKWQLFQHHLSFMTEELIDKPKRVALNDMKKNLNIFNLINEAFDFNLDFHQDYNLLPTIPLPTLYGSGGLGPTDDEDNFTPGKFFSDRYKTVKSKEEVDQITDLNCIFGSD